MEARVSEAGFPFVLSSSFVRILHWEASTFSLGIVEGISGVHTGPGATAFTRTPCSIASFAMLFVMLTIAAFVIV
jgi:hypothetical protein